MRGAFLRILVTGGAGFIGSQLARAYHERGDHVTVVDSLITGKRSRVPAGVEFQRLDITSSLLPKLLMSEQFDIVNHQAALISVSQSIVAPAADAEVNVLGTLRVLEAAVKAHVPTVVLASSSAVYGAATTIPITETAPIRPISPYGVAKRCVEMYAEVLSALHGLNVICLRYANVFGPGATVDAESGVIPLFVRALHSGVAPTICGDGSATRDYIYIDDIVRGNLAADTLSGFQVINLGTGVETSVHTLYAQLRERIGGPAARYSDERSGDIAQSALDTTFAAKTLHWRAEVGLAEGLDRLLRSASL